MKLIKYFQSMYSKMKEKQLLEKKESDESYLRFIENQLYQKK